MVDGFNQLPRMFIRKHMLAPRQGFITNHDVAFGRKLRQLMQIIGDDCIITHHIRCNTAAHQNFVGAQLLHQIKFSLSPLKIALQSITWPPLKISKRLKQHDVKV